MKKKAKPTPFRELVERARRRGVPDDAPPRSFSSIAEAAKLSRPFFYALMAGDKRASADSERDIAKALNVSIGTVHRVLAASEFV